MLRILFVGGGSIGHIAPSIAVWEEVKEKRPDACALFVCSARREERAFLGEHTIPHTAIHAPKSARSGTVLLFPALFLVAVLESFFVLLRFRPHAVFAKGGYVSAPLCAASWLIRIPIVLHESDRVLGKANAILLRCANHLCTGLPLKEGKGQKRAFRRGIPVTVTGNPVRKAIAEGARDRGIGVTRFSGRRPVLLAIGGSQGSHAINEAIRHNLVPLLDLCDVIHLTGRGKKGRSTLEHARYFVSEFEDRELPHLLALADLVVSRASGSVIAECSVIGKPMVLVPIPHLAGNHQMENARYFELAHAAVVARQETLKKTLVPTVRRILGNTEERNTLGTCLRTLASGDAAERIASIVIETANRD